MYHRLLLPGASLSASTAQTQSASTPPCKSGRQHMKSLLQMQRQCTSFFTNTTSKHATGSSEPDDDSLLGNERPRSLAFEHPKTFRLDKTTKSNLAVHENYSFEQRQTRVKRLVGF